MKMFLHEEQKCTCEAGKNCMCKEGRFVGKIYLEEKNVCLVRKVYHEEEKK